jgi:cell division septal protein FtsQ
MSSVSWANRTKKRPRRSEMRLGKSYEQTVARERVAVRSVARTRPAARISPRVGSLLLALASLAALAYMFLSDDFYVFDVAVQGNSLVTAQQVFQQSEVEGYSIFFIDPATIEDRIRAIPDVREATVEVSLPNVMVIDLQERQARAIWQIGEQRYGVDDEGMAVSLREEADPPITIKDLDGSPIELGQWVNLEVVTAAETYHALLPAIKEFEYSQEHGIGYLNEHGWRVYLGNGERAELKVAVLDALVKELTGRAAAVDLIDVRFPDSPLYRLAEPSDSEPE